MIEAEQAIALALAKRIPLEPERAKQLARRLIEMAAEPWPVFETARDRNALEELSHAVKAIERIWNGGLSETAQVALSERLFFGNSVKELAAKEALSDEEGMLSRILFLSEFEAEGAPERLALIRVANDAKSVLAAIEGTRREAVGPAGRTKPVNRPEVQAVDAARVCWYIAGGKDAPAKDLAIGSPFSNFLDDVFDALKLTGQPKSAFRAWVRETKKSPDR